MDKRPRNSTRNSSSVIPRCGCSLFYMLMSPYCRLCLCIGLIFSTGFIVGVLLDEYLLSEALLSASSQHHHFVPGETENVIDSGQKRYGSSIKKDLKFQFKDYVPEHVFVNCALGPSDSLELFLATYPDAHRYHLYTFLIDSSYKPIYAKFHNLTLYPDTVLSNSNNTSMINIPDTRKPGRNVSTPVMRINFSSWLKDTLHRDDVVVVKLCDDKTMLWLMNSLVETSGLEWIDKVYVPSADLLSKVHAQEKSGAYREKLFLWNDDMLTYSDFAIINQPANAGENTVEVTECHDVDADSNETQYSLLLYMSSLNQHSQDAIRLLNKISQKHRLQLPLTLFLPTQYMESYDWCAKLLSLGAKMELGLFLSGSFISAVSDFIDDDAKQSNLVRNKLVQAEHCFMDGGLILSYVLPEYVVFKAKTIKQEKKMRHSESNKLFKQTIHERGYTVMAEVKDVTHLVEVTDMDFFRHLAENTGKGLVAMDISMQGTDTLLLRTLNAHITSLIPAQICSMQGKMAI